jgi:hypothetical protein
MLPYMNVGEYSSIKSIFMGIRLADNHSAAYLWLSGKIGASVDEGKMPSRLY